MIVQKNIFATILSYLQNQVISEIVDEVIFEQSGYKTGPNMFDFSYQ